jgi:hypothetical protein
MLRVLQREFHSAPLLLRSRRFQGGKAIFGLTAEDIIEDISLEEDSKSGSIIQSPNAAGSSTNVQKIHIPKKYPQILPIPLTRRPLFPGFFKSLYITDTTVIQAIQNLLERRQPYVGVFLAKNDESTLDSVSSLDEIHRVGVFAQITNIYQSGPENSALTVVINPHRRIRAMELIKSSLGTFGNVIDAKPLVEETKSDAPAEAEKPAVDGKQVIL